MNKFVSLLIQFYKRNVRLFDILLLNWQNRFTERKVEWEGQTGTLMAHNREAIEQVIGK